MYVRIELLRAFLIDDQHTPIAKRLFELKERFVTSAATLIQLAHDLEERKKDLKLLSELKKIKNFKIIPVDVDIIEEAVKWKKKYNLSIYDAINVVTCLKLKEKIVTLETFFDKIPGIKREDPWKLVGVESQT
jgi:predicted nucleic acid-binding protein